MYAFSSGIEAEKAIRSLIKDIFFKESLFIVTLEVVDILEFEPISSSSFSEEKDKSKALEETFMGVEEVKILYTNILWSMP